MASPGGPAKKRVRLLRERNRCGHPAAADPDQRNSFLAAFLGWTMDAFDYFIVVLVYAEIVEDFGISLTQLAFLTTATLLMRSVGAFVFGMWADRPVAGSR